MAKATLFTTSEITAIARRAVATLSIESTMQVSQSRKKHEFAIVQDIKHGGKMNFNIVQNIEVDDVSIFIKRVTV